MKRKNTTRNALFTSVLSLLLCVSMLVGTTFAWFTDEVVTGMNTIAAGNLDVELYANGEQVKSNTELFKLDAANLWEPGVVAYENLQVANEGTLALKYQMTLNIGNENDLNGHTLSEVLKVAVIDKVPEGATRQAVLAAAKAAIEASQSDGSLSNFYLTGELEAGKSSTEQAIVIFWDPNDNATDNLYNANNGQETSDGDPLHIEFGINLQATQKMSEQDSFGPDYDEFASILPKATVINTGAQNVDVFVGYGYDADELALDTSFQFLPNETLVDPDGDPDSGDEYLDSAYRYWHADFVISADRDVPGGSMALAGYYEAWCGDNGWVALSSSDDIPAGTKIRLVQSLGDVNYEEICRYGNDGEGFRCGVADLTGENAGTTITVELRLYETTKAPDAVGGNANDEVVPEHYEVVGTYSYTFGEKVSTADELREAIEAGKSTVLTNDITYNNTDPDKQLLIESESDINFDGNGKTITVTGSDPSVGNHGYVAFIPTEGEKKATVSNLTVTGTGFVELGDYNVKGGTYVANNLVIENLVSTLANENGSDIVGCAFMQYGTGTLNNCVMTGTTALIDGTKPYDAGFGNTTTTTINGGEYGVIRVWEQAHVTIYGAEIDTIDSRAITTRNLGMLTIGAGTHVGTINLIPGTNYTPALTIEEGATVDAIVYNGVTYTQAEWLAR